MIPFLWSVLDFTKFGVKSWNSENSRVNHKILPLCILSLISPELSFQSSLGEWHLCWTNVFHLWFFIVTYINFLVSLLPATYSVNYIGISGHSAENISEWVSQKSAHWARARWAGEEVKLGLYFLSFSEVPLISPGERYFHLEQCIQEYWLKVCASFLQ